MYIRDASVCGLWENDLRFMQPLGIVSNATGLLYRICSGELNFGACCLTDEQKLDNWYGDHTVNWTNLHWFGDW